MAQFLASRRTRAVAAPKTETAPARRVVRRSTAPAPVPAQKPIGTLLKLIAEADTKMAELVTQREHLVAEVAKYLHDQKFDIGEEVVDHGYRAVIENVMSKASTEIDSYGLYEFMEKLGKEDDFWDAVKVQIGALKKLVTEREFAKIKKTEIPAKKTGERVVVEPVKVKGRK